MLNIHSKKSIKKIYFMIIIWQNWILAALWCLKYRWLQVEYEIEWLPALPYCWWVEQNRATTCSVASRMGINLKGLKSISGAFKLVELVSYIPCWVTVSPHLSSLQVLVLAAFLLASVGHQGALPLLGSELDHRWLGYGCLVAWLVILPSTVLGIILGDTIAWRTVSIAKILLYTLYC